MAGTVVAEPTFLEHVYELRKRLLIAVLFVITGAGVGWSLFQVIIGFLSKPLEQTLYYSAPTGELSFMIKVCLTFGIVVASPIIFYQVLRFIQPVLNNIAVRRIILYCLLSAGLAASGILFAYFVSLPMTLQFLLGMQGDGGLIQPLISADEYFNFVLAYIAGFAILFQIPLAVIVINKITPLTPSSLFKSFRFVIVFSFIAAAIITPTPDPINQTIMAVPVIVLYFISAMILLISQSIRKKTAPRAVVRTPLPATDLVPNLAKPTLLQAQIAPELRPETLATTPKTQPTQVKMTQKVSGQRVARPQRHFVQDIRRVRQSKPLTRPTYTRPLQQSPRIISDFL